MEFHAIHYGRRVLIHSDEIDMSKYERIDRAKVAQERRAAIVSGRAPAPNLTCNYCGAVVGKGAIWCSADCAKSYEDERTAVMGAPDGA